MRLAVVGHVEWVEFVAIDQPVAPGAIAHGAAGAAEAAGGGAVAAAELARLGGRCELHTAFGDDAVGQRLAAELAPHGVVASGPTQRGPHRRAITLVDPRGERTIVVIGDAQAPEVLPPLHGVDGVYVCKGSPAAVQAARAAKVVVATARILPVLRRAGVRLDAVVYSGSDPGEAYDGSLDAAAVVQTEGASGGRYWAGGREGRWQAAPVPAGDGDSYGCGDRFAAGLVWALAGGAPIDEAVRVAARSGAYARSVRGALGPRRDTPPVGGHGAAREGA